jgi:hypothetical protein
VSFAERSPVDIGADGDRSTECFVSFVERPRTASTAKLTWTQMAIDPATRRLAS